MKMRHIAYVPHRHVLLVPEHFLPVRLAAPYGAAFFSFNFNNPISLQM
jgi:hypothetical protein